MTKRADCRFSGNRQGIWTDWHPWKEQRSWWASQVPDWPDDGRLQPGDVCASPSQGMVLPLTPAPACGGWPEMPTLPSRSLSHTFPFSGDQETPGFVCPTGLFGNLVMLTKPFSEQHKNIQDYQRRPIISKCSFTKCWETYFDTVICLLPY